jgi:DNA-binding MarR family transcriptional regulator
MTFPVSHAGLEYVLSRIIQDFMKFMHQTGLSTPQINALLHIYHAGECQLSEIGNLADSSKPAASQLVERLVQQDLVERTEDPLDRRNKKLRLAPKGLELIQQGVISNSFLMELTTYLSVEQQETIHTAFGYLAQAGRQVQALEKQEDHPSI